MQGVELAPTISAAFWDKFCCDFAFADARVDNNCYKLMMMLLLQNPCSDIADVEVAEDMPTFLNTKASSFADTINGTDLQKSYGGIDYHLETLPCVGGLDWRKVLVNCPQGVYALHCKPKAGGGINHFLVLDAYRKVVFCCNKEMQYYPYTVGMGKTALNTLFNKKLQLRSIDRVALLTRTPAKA